MTYYRIAIFWLLLNGTLLLAQEAAPLANTGIDTCLDCHRELQDDPALQFDQGDIHHQRGLTCAACHGGDPTATEMEESMDPARGFIGVPPRSEIPSLCGTCHADPAFMRQFNPQIDTDQLARWLTSVHGQRHQAGDMKVAVCSDCHNAHGVLSSREARSPIHPSNVPGTCGRCHADPEHMAPYDIPTDQVAEYETSVHAAALQRGDLSAPVCNDCHGNHGAVPPGIPSIGFVCGQCHVNNQELFRQSPHWEIFQELDLPQCETCHGNHAIAHPRDSFLAPGPENTCSECHLEGSTGLQTGLEMHRELEELKTSIAEAREVVETAEQAGMLVSEALFQLQEADDSVIRSRTVIHSLSVDQVRSVTAQGKELATSAAHAGEEALEELQFRRKGLGVALVFILILAVGLYLKIKEVDRRYPMTERVGKE